MLSVHCNPKFAITLPQTCLPIILHINLLLIEADQMMSVSDTAIQILVNNIQSRIDR